MRKLALCGFALLGLSLAFPTDPSDSTRSDTDRISLLEPEGLLQYYPSEPCAKFRNDTRFSQKLDAETIISLQTQLAPEKGRGFNLALSPAQAQEVIQYCVDTATENLPNALLDKPIAAASRTGLCLLRHRPFNQKNEQVVGCFVWNLLTTSGYAFIVSPIDIAKNIAGLVGDLPDEAYKLSRQYAEGDERIEEAVEQKLGSYLSANRAPGMINLKELTIGTGQSKHLPDPTVADLN